MKNIKWIENYMKENSGLLRIIKFENQDFSFVLRDIKLDDGGIELKAPTIKKGFQRLQKAIEIIDSEKEVGD